jgi:hypothetical protein
MNKLKVSISLAMVASLLVCLLVQPIKSAPIGTSCSNGSHGGFVLQASVFDPANTGSPASFFENVDGLLALHMTMAENVAYPPGAAAGGSILGPRLEKLTKFVPNLTLSQVAFDITKDSQNAGGAPRFNIYDNKGNYWLMTCLEFEQNGTTGPVTTHGKTSSQWARISCNPANVPELSNGPNPGLPFTNTTVVSEIDIVFDAVAVPGAYANLANVSLNGGPACAPDSKH